jgi:hypothetical protein
MTERLDLSSEEGKALLQQSRTAVANDDVALARSSNIALTEGEGQVDEGSKTNIGDYYNDVPETLSTDEYYEKSTPAISPEKSTEAALHAALASDTSEDPLQDFTTVKSELSLSGESPTYQEIAEQVKEDAHFELESIVDDAAIEGDIEAVNKLVSAAPLLLLERSAMRLRALENASENQVIRDPSIRGREYQQWYQDRFEERIQGRKAVNAVFDRSISGSSLDIAENLQDIAGTLVVSEQLFLGRAAEAILGERYWALGGDMKADLASWIKEASTAEEQAQRAETVAEEISNAAGFKGSNDVVKVFALEIIREYLQTPSADIDWFRAIDNIAGVIGVVPFISEAVVAKGLRTLFSAGKVARSSGRDVRVLDDIQEADPELGSKLNAAAIKDEVVAENLNLPKTEAVKRALPHGEFQPDVHLEGAPKQLVDDLAGAQTKADQIDDMIENTYLFSDADYKSAQKRIVDILSDDEVVGIAKPSITSMGRDGNGIKAKVIYGEGEGNYPIPTLEKATELKAMLDAKLKLNPAKGEGATILLKDDVTGAFVLPKKGTVYAKAQFYVSVDQKLPMLFGDLVPDASTGQIGRVKRWIMDPNSFISRNLIGAGRIANEKKAFVNRELTAIAKPFLSLNHRGKVRVSDLLTSGEEAG